MEYALSDGAPYFAGGLGVLAADYLLEAGKENKDFTAFGLGYHKEGVLLDALGFQKVDMPLSLPLSDRKIDLIIWKKSYGSAQIYLFDTSSASNSAEDREITTSPYGPDYWTMLKQQVVLAMGSAKLIRTLGLKPDVYHLNEGHTAFVLWGLAKEGLLKIDDLRFNNEASNQSQLGQNPIIVATKHTILSESGLFIPREDLEKLYNMCCTQGEMPFDQFFSLASDENHKGSFSTNKFLLKFANKSSGVSGLHIEFEKKFHPNSPLISITNGIFPDRWRSKLFTQPAEQMTNEQLWQIQSQNKKTMIDFVNQKAGFNLDPALLTIVWARRLVDYKQPTLIFSDLARLAKIVSGANSVQFIIAGSVHTSDPSSMAIAQTINDIIKRPELSGRIAFHPHNSLSEAQIMVAGADIWLNTPQVGKEACGTSGMKAALNGALMASTPDGWIPESDWSGLGWVLSPENTANSLYTFLENEMIPLYYSRDEKSLPTEWISRMRRTIKIIEEKYTTARMLAQYEEKLYA